MRLKEIRKTAVSQRVLARKCARNAIVKSVWSAAQVASLSLLRFVFSFARRAARRGAADRSARRIAQESFAMRTD
ncbi:hypothetical protein D6817_01710 [Candidatus Pacearchaeota archaeon]|nr:MAG: hypothetical protein D6817_01710 [Candidatus Pacearchaeota archaeon]